MTVSGMGPGLRRDDEYVRLMAHEIDPVELVAEALAGGERGLKIGFAEHISLDLAEGDDSGVARLAADQRDLAEESAAARRATA